jgi:Family of unknown function (DUF6194)
MNETVLNQEDITRFILEVLPDVTVATAYDALFFSYNPDGRAPEEQKFPFATLVTSDAHDAASNLERVGVYRLNIGVKPETYAALFGKQPAFPRDGGIIGTGHDFAALDVLMPHPVYAAMSWVCVLNPSARTFERIKPLLEEAHGVAMKRRHSSS